MKAIVRFKKQLLVIAIAVFSFLVCTLGITTFVAKADGNIVVSESSVRVEDPTGIRFKGVIKNPLFAEVFVVTEASGGGYDLVLGSDGQPQILENAEVGMIIVPMQALQNATGDYFEYLRTTFGKEKEHISTAVAADTLIYNVEDNQVEFNCAIVSILPENYTYSYCAVAYYINANGQLFYSEVGTPASLLEVSNGALSNPNDYSDEGKETIAQMVLTYIKSANANIVANGITLAKDETMDLTQEIVGVNQITGLQISVKTGEDVISVSENSCVGVSCGDAVLALTAYDGLFSLEVSVKIEHVYGELVAKEAATCVETGMNAHYRCTVCDKYFTENKEVTTADALVLAVDGNNHAQPTAFTYTSNDKNTHKKAHTCCGVIENAAEAHTFVTDKIHCDAGCGYTRLTVALAEGVTASIGNDTLTPDGNVVVVDAGDVVTLTKAYAENTKLAFFVNGNKLNTACENNTATASFTAEENATVAVETYYLVSGSVTNTTSYSTELTNVTVKVKSGDTVVETVAVSELGEFSVYLENGDYALVAECVGLIGESALNVANEAMTDVAVVLDTITVINKTHRYDLVYANGTYTATSNQDAGGYLAGASVAEGATFMVKVNVGGMTMGNFAAAGLLVGTEGTNFVEFTLRNFNGSPDRYDFTIRRRADVNGSTQIYKRYTFTDSDLRGNALGANDAGAATLELVYYAGNYYVYVNGIEAFVLNENTKDMVESGTNATFSIKDVIGTGNVKFGLFLDGKAVLSDWSYATNEDTVCDTYFKRNISIPADVTVSVGGDILTSEGNVVSAFKGEVVTITKTIAENSKITFIVNGTEIETVCEGTTATATFTLTQNVEITYENAYLLSGSVSNQITSYELDYSTVEVEIMNGNTVVASVTPDSDGSFNVYLPNGEYTVTAIHTALTGESISVTVADGETDNNEIVFDVPLVVSEFTAGTSNLRSLVYENGAYSAAIPGTSSYAAVGGYLAGAVAEEGATFAIKTELFNFAGTGNPTAGIVVGSTTSDITKFMTFTFRRFNTTTFDFIRRRTVNVYGTDCSTQIYARSTFVSGSSLEQYNGTDHVEMALVYYHGDYYIFFDGVLTFTFNENTKDLNTNAYSIKDAIGTGSVQFGLFAEGQAYMTNWSYSLDETSIVSTYFPAGQEVVSSVGKNNRTLYYDNGTYNNKIPELEAYSTAGVYLAGAVAAENQTFAIEVTAYDYADFSGLGAGFIVGSVAGAKNQFMAFALRRFGSGTSGTFDFVQERVAGIDSSSRVYKRFTFSNSSFTNADRTTGLTMALVYKQDTYYIFVKVGDTYEQALTFADTTSLDGGTETMTTAAMIGTGAVKFGLYASEGGLVRLKDWSYSLDTQTIDAKYFA